MRWPWRKKKKDNSEAKHEAHQAVRDARQAKTEAEIRWREVNKVTDEFADAFERAVRRIR